MNEIEVSVILSAYNEEERWFRESVESILNQSYRNFELILILDNPKNTLLEEIIKEYTNKDNRIVYIKNEKNLGLVRSLNKGIEQAKGKYIARMDADDIADVDRLKKQYEFMEANKSIDLLGTSVDFIDESNCIIQKNTFVVKNSNRIKKYLKYTNVVVHPTFFFRKSILKKVNGYREIPFAEDYDFICRVVAAGFKVSNLSESLLQYRIRQNSISRDKTLAQLYNAFYLKKLYKERLNSGKDSYSFDDLYSENKISNKDVRDFDKSERLKLKADNIRKNGKVLKGKVIFFYSKVISKYARKNAVCTTLYKILTKIYE